MRNFTYFMILSALLLTSCRERGVSVQFSETAAVYRLLSLGSWSVRYTPVDETVMKLELNTESRVAADETSEVDSLNYSTVLPDSLRFNRKWYTGGSSVLVFSVTVPDWGNEQLVARARTVCREAQIVRPSGLRSVYLSDRTGSEIDSERASTAVEPPPDVTHHFMVYYQQDSTGTLLEIIDSLVVDFRESNADSLAFTFIHRGASSVISSTAGIFRRDSIPYRYFCFADSSGLYTGVFRNHFQMNIPYLDTSGEVSVQSRLTSAYLSGNGYYPLSLAPARYSVRVFLPDSITSWTPLIQGDTPEEWYSPPGGIVGGLPIAIGNYTESSIFPRYRMLLLEGSPISSLDSTAVYRIASVLRNTIDFPSAQFSFVEIINPGGPVVASAFGGMLFSRGSLESLADVSLWDEKMLNGIVPAGCSILTDAAMGILVQSLHLDPIIMDMMSAWIPLRYCAESAEDEAGIAKIRSVYLKYYLFNTQNAGGNGSTPVVAEYALGDPRLLDSPLRPYVTAGKGVIVLEYLNSLRMLNRMPYLLQNFTHASSGNFWQKISLSLRVYTGTKEYSLLRALLYQPGIPQIRVLWWKEGDRVLLTMAEIQPGPPFDLEFSKCQLYFPDTTVVRTLLPADAPGVFQCFAEPSVYGEVTAVDLNYGDVIPADLMYTRVRDGRFE
jgi:hypothetical protein